jgi:hypothetical protein
MVIYGGKGENDVKVNRCISCIGKHEQMRTMEIEKLASTNARRVSKSVVKRVRRCDIYHKVGSTGYAFKVQLHMLFLSRKLY